MDFKDFKPEELIGKLVLYRSGDTYNHSSYIRTIERVTKKGFAISGSKNLFSRVDGHHKGHHGWAKVSYCELITQERANELTEEWRLKKELKKVKEAIIHEVNSGRPTFAQMKEAAKALGLVEQQEQNVT